MRFYVKEVVYAVRYLSAGLCGDESYRVCLKYKSQFSGCVVFRPGVAVNAAVLQNLVEIGDERSRISEFAALLFDFVDELLMLGYPVFLETAAAVEFALRHLYILFEHGVDAVFQREDIYSAADRERKHGHGAVEHVHRGTHPVSAGKRIAVVVDSDDGAYAEVDLNERRAVQRVHYDRVTGFGVRVFDDIVPFFGCNLRYEIGFEKHVYYMFVGPDVKRRLFIAGRVLGSRV